MWKEHFELLEMEVNNKVRPNIAPTKTLEDMSTFVDTEAPIILSWTDLCVTAKSKRGFLLNNISGFITEGLWAVMGSSGSGKTTLLSALSHRLDNFSVNVTGQLHMNNKPYTKRDLKSMSGYVMQGTRRSVVLFLCFHAFVVDVVIVIVIVVVISKLRLKTMSYTHTSQ